MGARAYKKDSHVRKLVEHGGFEKKAAQTSVEVQYEVVEEVTENLASEEFVKSEFKAQREYMDKELAEMKAEMKEQNSKITGVKVEIAKLGTRFMFIAVGVVALMQGLAWLSQQGG